MTSPIRPSTLISALAIIMAVALVRNWQLRQELDATAPTIEALAAGSLRMGASRASGTAIAPLILLQSSTSPTKPSVGFLTSTVNKDCSSCAATPSPGEGTATIATGPARDLVQAAAGLGLLPARAQFILFVFFAPSDCPACLREASIWQKSSLTIDNLAVIGIMDRAQPGSAHLFIDGAEIGFPVLLDPTSALRRAFGLVTTPEKVLVDRTGAIKLTAIPNKTVVAQQVFSRRLREACLGQAARHAP